MLDNQFKRVIDDFIFSWMEPFSTCDGLKMIPEFATTLNKDL